MLREGRQILDGFLAGLPYAVSCCLSSSWCDDVLTLGTDVFVGAIQFQHRARQGIGVILDGTRSPRPTGGGRSLHHA